jgi:hypothetical protein
MRLYNRSYCIQPKRISTLSNQTESFQTKTYRSCIISEHTYLDAYRIVLKGKYSHPYHFHIGDLDVSFTISKLNCFTCACASPAVFNRYSSIHPHPLIPISSLSPSPPALAWLQPVWSRQLPRSLSSHSELVLAAVQY